MNGMRIASQAGEWPFEQYKSNVGEKQEFGDKLELKNTISYKFTAKVNYESHYIIKVTHPDLDEVTYWDIDPSSREARLLNNNEK